MCNIILRFFINMEDYITYRWCNYISKSTEDYITCRWCNYISTSLEDYRSGHNEAVLKTVCLHGHGGSNPSSSATGATPSSRNKKSTLYECFFSPLMLAPYEYKSKIPKRFSNTRVACYPSLALLTNLSSLARATRLNFFTFRRVFIFFVILRLQTFKNVEKFQ